MLNKTYRASLTRSRSRQCHDNLFRRCKFFTYEPLYNPSCFVKLVQAPCAAMVTYMLPPFIYFSFLFIANYQPRARISRLARNSFREYIMIFHANINAACVISAALFLKINFVINSKPVFSQKRTIKINTLCNFL